MNNFTAYEKDRWGLTNHRKKGAPHGDGQIWISDSGGFQLGSVKVRYLDPVKVVDWYADNTDIGIALDIPVHPHYGELLDKANRVQKRNTDIMLERKPKRLELMTALHGGGYQNYIQSADTLVRDEITKLSFSGFPAASLIDALLALTGVHQKYGKQHDHYHLLGVSGIDKILVFARWAAMIGKDITVTADSSRHIQEAVRWGYYTRVGASQRLFKFEIGYNAYGSINHGRPQTLPCQCPVCKSIKWLEVLSQTRRAAIIPHFIIYHNQFVIQETMNKIWDYAQAMDDKQYREFGLSMIRQAKRHEFDAGLSFLGDAHKKIDRLVKTYQYFGGKVLRFDEQGDNQLDEQGWDTGENSKRRKYRHKHLKRTIRGYLKDKFKPEDHGKLIVGAPS